ncbi:MAG: carboxypeptidase regulatory-like domain-containing protein [Terracidiphilus sp.]
MGLDRKACSWLRLLGYITLTCFCFVLLQSQSAFGQVDEGSITGTVQDATGAVVANAQVTLLNTDQGITLQTKTNDSGGYTFSPVRIGHYSLSVTAKGFAKTTQQNLTLNVAQTLLVNVQLKLGSASETVEVTTAPPLMQTEEASVGQVISQESVNDLPLNGRNFTFLAQLGAGMQTPQADTRGNAASGAFSANGLRPAQNNYLLDGIDNNSDTVDFLNGTNFIVLPPVDAIQEFKVQTADFSAELGRSAGAVLNATIKSGTNSLHGAAWEFFRNRVLDAADWFEDYNGTGKGAYEQNQFGVSAGGPIVKNKIFVFGDYEGLRRVQGSSTTGAVPSLLESGSGFTNMTDLISAQASSTPLTDDLGRTIPQGTVLDPATTRAVTAGVVDPVTGIAATTTGYVRDPFGYSTCSSAGKKAPTLAACSGLNTIPAARLDQNAIALLKLYPAPTNNSVSSLFSNYGVSPGLYEHRNAFDVRADFNASDKDQVFYRFSYVDDPQYIPGIFGGVADGGAFQQGIQNAHSNQTAAAWTHVFSPNAVNVGRVGLNHLHTSRFGPEGSVMGIPAQYGIQGIQQLPENGGLPEIDFGGLATLGSNGFLPSDEISQTLQLTDDFTKIWGKHSFKMGIEQQFIKFDTLQPAYSRGNFDFNGTYVDVPTTTSGNLGRAQFLLTPAPVTANSEGETIPSAAAVNYSGGSDSIQASNISTTYDYKTYTALYLQDDWKLNPKLTINLGLRWDYFGPIQETNGGQANFVPSALNGGTPTYLIPKTGKDIRTLSSTAATPSLAGDGFVDLLAKDGITLEETNQYGRGLVQNQKANFAPRVGFAYQITPKLVSRGGFGIFYNSFENQGYSPNIGENYPFVYNLSYGAQVPAGSPNGLQGVSPISYQTPWAGCATAGPGGTATIDAGLSCVALSPGIVNAEGLGLEGAQFDWQTPRTLSANLTFQYSITRTLSATAAYVWTHGEDLQAGTGTNNVSQILNYNASTTNAVPFPDFSHGMSYQATVGASDYNSLQTKLEQQFSNGFTYLLAYTWSKTMSDAGDLLNGGSTGGFRAPSVPGLGVSFDRGLADFDIRQVLHFSGGYQLPFGKDKRFLNQGGVSNAVFGGWAVNWIATLQGGQPLNIGCVNGTASGLGCNAVKVAGQSQKLGLHKDSNGVLSWFGNPAAFSQPCEVGNPGVPAGCVTATGSAVLGDEPGQTVTPGFHRLDFSTFKAIQMNDRFLLQFRAEFFNILNHPNFNAPGFGGNGVVSIGGSTNYTSNTFGEIGSTRDNPNDPREIQFALKLYY